MSDYIKIPNYMQKELEQARNYILKFNKCIGNFEQWVKENTNEYFEFAVLRGCAEEVSGLTWEDQKFQTEALTEIEYGNEVDIDALERSINYFKDKF